MKILIAGATGQVGFLAVEQALLAGHEVTAMARTPERLNQGPPGRDGRLRLFRGDVLDSQAVGLAVEGQEAVVLVYGAPLNWQTLTRVPVLRAQSTRLFVDAMTRSGVRRLVVMTGIGAGDSRPSGRPVFRHLIRPLLLGRIYVDMDRQEQIVRETSLDWTIVRPAELTNKPPTGGVRVVVNYAVERADTIGRPAVARFLVGCCNDVTSIRKAFVITG